MTSWCFLNFGPEAIMYLDINENTRWRSERIYVSPQDFSNILVFDFYDDSEATYFSLVWTNDE